MNRRDEWTLQSEFAELLTEYLDPRCAWFTSLENKPLSRISGMLQRKRGVKSGLPDVQVLYRRKPFPRCPTHVVFVELKAPGGVASQSQKRTRLEMLPTGAKWWMARTARRDDGAASLRRTIPVQVGAAAARAVGGTISGPDKAPTSASGSSC